MSTKNIEYETTMKVYRKGTKETDEFLDRVLGRYVAPERSLQEMRREISKQLKGISLSRAIIEAR